ncbi:TonB-dependent receptor plug domain-containing protein, partial [Brevundimonas sp.]
MNNGRRLGLALLLGTTALSAAVAADPVQAQSGPSVSFDIPAQPLGAALAAYSRTSGVDIVYGETLPNVRSTAVSGQMTPLEGLSRLLAGSGLTYRSTGAGTVRLEAAPQATGGVIQLGTVRVEGASGSPTGGNKSNGSVAGWDGTAETTYVTPGSVSVITRATLDDYPGTSPADMLKSVTGVLSGESRNSGGLDVNIRGMQGQGRVPVTVDGSLNG